MATIVRQHMKNKLYILLGCGYGESKTSRPNPLTAITSVSSHSESSLVAVASSDGEIDWIPSHELTVVSVDGVSCKDLLDQAYSQSRPNS